MSLQFKTIIDLKMVNNYLTTCSLRILIVTTAWPNNNHPCAVPFLVQHVEFLRQQGVTIYVYSFEGKRNIVNYLKAWWKIRREPFWKKVNIIHAHWAQSAFLALFSKKKLVITFHGSDLHGIVKSDRKYSFTGKVLVFFSKWIATKADYCILVSQHMKNILSSKIKNMAVIPIGIDFSNFYPMKKTSCRITLGLDPAGKYILFVGDPEQPEKNFEFSKKAITNYNSIHHEVEIHLLVANNIPYAQMPIYMNAADALILSSVHEGSPTVIKEAIACHTPIVSFDVGDVRQRIQGNPACYLCKEKTVEELVCGLTTIFMNYQPNIPTSQALWQIDESSNVKEVISIYNQLSG